jgi:uncharacterized protein (DUF3820 family)
MFVSSFVADAQISLRIRAVEAKLLRLALDPGARGNEITTSAEKLINHLRARGVLAAEVFSSPAPPRRAVDNTLANAHAMIMPFGKHRNKRLGDIPLSYLRWVENNCDNASPRLRKAISIILDGD